LYVWLSGAAPGSEVTRNLRLHEILRISAGESVELPIELDDPACEDFLDEWWCRRVRVVSQGAGLLRMTVSADTVDHAFVIAGPGIGVGPNVRVPVAAGSETIVDVLLRRRPPQKATLSTSLEPS